MTKLFNSEQWKGGVERNEKFENTQWLSTNSTWMNAVYILRAAEYELMESKASKNLWYLWVNTTNRKQAWNPLLNFFVNYKGGFFLAWF